jgi:hypothetical protein
VSEVLDRPGQRIGAEFRGLARRFRDEVYATDARMENGMTAVIMPLHRRLQRHVRLRKELAQSAGVIYRKLLIRPLNT